MQWRDIPVEFRDKRQCASDGCTGLPVANFEAWGVGSDYCQECAEKIFPLTVSTPNEAIDEGAHDTYAGDPQ